MPFPLPFRGFFRSLLLSPAVHTTGAFWLLLLRPVPPLTSYLVSSLAASRIAPPDTLEKHSRGLSGTRRPAVFGLVVSISSGGRRLLAVSAKEKARRKISLLVLANGTFVFAYALWCANRESRTTSAGLPTDAHLDDGLDTIGPSVKPPSFSGGTDAENSLTTDSGGRHIPPLGSL